MTACLAPAAVAIPQLSGLMFRLVLGLLLSRQVKDFCHRAVI